MSTLLVLALIATVVLVLYWALRRCRLARYEADRRTEIARAARARRLAEVRINHLAQSALEQMIEVAQRDRFNTPPSR
ncbi:hypothetical protein [Gordonia sp. (in: high G+C Gram-positive bacteria)]|uniref:hypothetical protein n=1 Tax=Gordonia sp. (in: high G+C Gram-positive bacteria) TaxID=84139 RepID=UPI00261E6CC1|nr:hypothetical protein [Gordonia sp. (in: high G+C Gram-positive bacteria)]